jgi:hypothetical protein
MLLPVGIDYNRYLGNSGSSTSKWGKSGWDFLFISITSYPVKIDNRNPSHTLVKKSFIDLFASLRYTLPCIYCRESYIDFYKKIKIEKFLIGRIELMYWLYLIKDAVNKKLIIQELECCKGEKIRLKRLFLENEITFDDYRRLYVKFKNDTLVTVESPPFKDVLDKYEIYRSTCSKKAKKCQ